ncbi:MAG: N-acetylmuramoyl-L-alanine amidase, partial [Tannerella sp.]|nr:N-acetylmuramoyl-L-alanine amidase [Tannerella sp.]
MRIYTLLICIFSFCCVSIYSKEVATPKAGEGVYRFLINNGRSPDKYYDAFIELNKGKLGKNNTLIKGVFYTLPPLSNDANEKKDTATKGNRKKEPLFGKKYEEYTVNSSKLKGATFYLASGHGGPDCGAIGMAEGREIHEDEYAYDIMLRLARNLMMEGATVHIIIQDKKDGIRDERFLTNSKNETCMGKEIPLNQKKRLQQRCDAINNLYDKSKNNYRRAIFIHLDSRSNSSQMDVYFFHQTSSTDGKRLGNTFRQTFKAQYQKHQPNRGFTGTVGPRDLYVLNNSKPAGVFVELGNIQNA